MTVLFLAGLFALVWASYTLGRLREQWRQENGQ